MDNISYSVQENVVFFFNSVHCTSFVAFSLRRTVVCSTYLSCPHTCTELNDLLAYLSVLAIFQALKPRKNFCESL